MKNKRGVSFVEIMIMLMVLSICIIPMIRMFTTAISETNYIDDMLTAVDLAREEAEKIKNLGLSKDQIKRIGNILSQPVYLNRRIWRTARYINAEKDPMEVFIYVFQGDDLSNSLMTLATMVSK